RSPTHISPFLKLAIFNFSSTGLIVRFSATSYQLLFSNFHFPVSIFQFPVSSFQFPVPGLQFPLSSFQFLISSFQLPASGFSRGVLGAEKWVRFERRKMLSRVFSINA